MNRLLLVGFAPLLLAQPAAAQTMDHSAMDHSAMPGMAMPSAPASPAQPAAPQAAPAAADAHAGHAMPGMAPGAPSSAQTPSMPGMAMPMGDMAGHDMTAMAQPEIPKSPPPPAPADHLADRFYDPSAMAAARSLLRQEHGAQPLSMVMANLLEYQTPRSGQAGYRWEGEAWFGSDVNRLVLKSEGQGKEGEGLEDAELQALYSRAIGPYFDLQAGVRQDFEPRGRTYATVGLEGLAPYWFDVQGALFLSTKGELLARAETTYDLRLTQRLILQPRAELNLSAQDTPETRTGSGLADAELGLRLRYEVRREFAPYVGVSWDRKFGKTADYARAAGEDRSDVRFVVGIRSFF